jgi:integrase
MKPEQKSRFPFSEKRLMAVTEPGTYTDESSTGLRFRLSPTTKRCFWLGRGVDDDGHPFERSLGEYIRPAPRKGDRRFPDHVSLTAARDKLAELRRKGPPAKHTEPPPDTAPRTLRDDMSDYFADHAPSWKLRSRKIRLAGETSMMERHASALLRMPSETITSDHVTECMKTVLVHVGTPRWDRKPPDMIPTARAVRNLLRLILDHARYGKHKALFPADWVNPAAVRRFKLPKRSNRAFPQMPLITDHRGIGLQDYYKFCTEFKHVSRTKYAARLQLLTLGPRPQELCDARWEQFPNLEDADPVWLIPNETMKVDKERDDNVFIRPLSAQAVRLLLEIRPADWRPGDYVFPAIANRGKPRRNRPMITGTLARFQREHAKTGVPHGMRHAMLAFVGHFYPYLLPAAKLALDHLPIDGSSRDYWTTQLPLQLRFLAGVLGDWLEEKIDWWVRTPHPPIGDPPIKLPVPSVPDRKRSAEQARERAIVLD